jgi:hypothetical protein
LYQAQFYQAQFYQAIVANEQLQALAYADPKNQPSGVTVRPPYYNIN